MLPDERPDVDEERGSRTPEQLPTRASDEMGPFKIELGDDLVEKLSRLEHDEHLGMSKSELIRCAIQRLVHEQEDADAPSTKISVELSQGLNRSLEHLAEELDISKSAVVRNAIELMELARIGRRRGQYLVLVKDPPNDLLIAGFRF